MTKPRELLSRGKVTAVVAVVMVGAGFLIWQGLSDASVYFLTADQATERKASLGSKRFRLEGTVLTGSVKKQEKQIRFTVYGDKAKVKIVHRGDQPQLFKEEIPVVAEGSFKGEIFESDTILVKHSETYQEKYPDRVKDYDEK